MPVPRLHRTLLGLLLTATMAVVHGGFALDLPPRPVPGHDVPALGPATWELTGRFPEGATTVTITCLVEQQNPGTDTWEVTTRAGALAVTRDSFPPEGFRLWVTCPVIADTLAVTFGFWTAHGLEPASETVVTGSAGQWDDARRVGETLAGLAPEQSLLDFPHAHGRLVLRAEYR